jgi:hypothetical protein
MFIFYQGRPMINDNYFCRAAGIVDVDHRELQVDPQGAGRKIADPANAVIVEAGLRPPTGSADRFFERRTSVTTRARGSPKMPTTVGSGRKPGKRYESERRRGLRFRIAARACTVSAQAEMPSSALQTLFLGHPATFPTHTNPRRALLPMRRATR